MVSQWLCPGNPVLLHSGPKYKSSGAGSCDMPTRSPDLLKVISFKVERWNFSTYGLDMVAGHCAWAWWHICLNLSRKRISVSLRPFRSTQGDSVSEEEEKKKTTKPSFQLNKMKKPKVEATQFYRKQILFSRNCGGKTCASFLVHIRL